MIAARNHQSTGRGDRAERGRGPRTDKKEEVL